MKKAFSLLIIIMLSVLSGCSGSIYAQYRELEQMRIIQIMGIDYDDSGVQLSLASSGGKNSQDAPAALSASASSISTALQRIRNFPVKKIFSALMWGISSSVKKPPARVWKIFFPISAIPRKLG